jgi:hypothetical protein
MTEESLRSSLDAALKHLDPNRRQFLGMLLASAAALPLLTSSDLAVAQTTRPYKELGPAHKGSNTQQKCSNPQLKNSNQIKISNQFKNSNQIKNSNQQHKSSNTQYKDSNPHLKGSNQQLKNSGSAHQGRVY